ncbi:MAG: major capsid protein [Pseudodesulfovibrio sp.]|uniref:major capsid protein n=1 Tax=Pseudodesulfovibrio sp. TaxID=2035812 RepID=UPI003D0DB0D0
MVTVGSRNLTLGDLAKRQGQDGKIDKIAEILNEDHEILEDMVFKECNDGTSNKTSVRTGIPEPTWRMLYGGVKSTKSSTKQVVDSCGMLEALPKIDVDVIDKSSDPKGALLSEHVPHLEGVRQSLESSLFYDDTALHPERFSGFSPRYNAYTRATEDDAYSDFNVLDGGGVGADNTSIWLVTWSDETCFGLYPKGSSAGLSSENLGKKLVTADDGSGEFLAYVTHYKWDVGLCVKDWRSVGRICNIDYSALLAEEGAADLIKMMIRLSERIQGNGRKAWYMNPSVRTALRLQMLGKTNVNLEFDTVEGRKVLHFDETPVRASKKLLLTEATLPQAVAA